MIGVRRRAVTILEDYANYYSEKDVDNLAEVLGEVRAEAIREFVERLFERVAVKTLVGKSEDYSDGFIEATCWYDEEIDNLLKEKTEDK